MADKPEGDAAIQKDLNRLEECAGRNPMKLNKGRCKALHPGRNNPRHQHLLMATQMESSFVGSDLGVLVDAKLNTSQPHALPAKQVNSMGCIKQSITSRAQEVILCI